MKYMNESTKRRALVVFVVLSAIPPFFLLPFPSSLAATSVSLWLADSLGYVGIVLLLWMFILGAKSVMGTVFRDLAPVLSIHKWLGKYGPLAIFIHPLLITFSYGESWLYSFLPQVATEFQRHVTLGRIGFWVLLLTWVTSALLRDRIAFRPWKYLHYLAYLCIPFALLHVPDVGSYYMQHTVVKGYYFVLVVAFLCALAIRLRGFFNLDKTAYEVVSHTQLGDGDYALNLRPLHKHRLAPRRGQYIYLKLGLLSEDHPFSVLQYDEQSGDIAVGYRVFGSFTRFVSTIKKGARVYLGGPFGSFMSQYDTDDRPSVFLAGGIGITPFIDQMIHGYGKREQWLFAANRSRSTSVLVPQVTPYIAQGRLVSVYNNEPSPLQTGEENGFITADLLRKYLGDDLTRYSFYLCGPPPMMKAMTALLSNLNISPSQVKSEKFGW